MEEDKRQADFLCFKMYIYIFFIYIHTLCIPCYKAKQLLFTEDKVGLDHPAKEQMGN